MRNTFLLKSKSLKNCPFSNRLSDYEACPLNIESVDISDFYAKYHNEELTAVGEFTDFKTLIPSYYDNYTVGYRYESDKTMLMFVGNQKTRKFDTYIVRMKAESYKNVLIEKKKRYTLTDIKRLLKTHKLLSKVNSVYSDDYKYDADTNFGKQDSWSLVSEKDIKELLIDLKCKGITIHNSNKEEKTFDVITYHFKNVSYQLIEQ